MAAGRAPALAALVARGSRGPLATLHPTLSPALWTTIATGQPPSVHGVENFVVQRPQVTLALGALPAGDLVLRLAVEVTPPCGREALELYLNRSRLTDVSADDAGVRATLPAAARQSGGDALVLRLPARCAAASGVKAAPAPWGRLAAVTLTTATGAAVAAPAPADVVRDPAAGRPGPAGDVLLVGRQVAQVESGDRRVPAIWTIASARGRTVDVVGWWSTWPAEAVRGTMVSDFLFFASTRRLLGLADVGDEALQAAAVQPPAQGVLLAEALAPRWEMSAEELARFVPRESPRFAAHLAVPARVHALGDPPLAVLKDTYLINRPYFAIARRLLAAEHPDLLLVYTNLVDAVEHKFWRYYEPARFGAVAAEDVADFGDTIPRAYAHVDAELAALVAGVGPDTVVLVVSDHGHHAALKDGVFSGEHADAPPGILVAAGPGIRAGGRIDGAGIIDVAPTLLALLGLPVADDMPGHVLSELFAAPPRVERVATYRDVLPAPTTGAPAPALDDGVRERLRALGYLQ
jgi:Type I phosphodiesterase / nucleotide pyrophosphatase